jgi:hypothetical protein
VREHRGRDALDVLGHDVVGDRARLLALFAMRSERDTGSRARSEREQRLSRVPEELTT